jgi:hypothetical protein
VVVLFHSGTNARRHWMNINTQGTCQSIKVNFSNELIKSTAQAMRTEKIPRINCAATLEAGFRAKFY